MKRRATRNTIGWVLLGSGVTMAAVSYLTYAGNGFNGTWKLEPLFNAGCVSVIASVPFFIMARQNKIKARFAVNLQKTPLETAFLKTYYPSLSLRIER
ncbi:MAG: hypothetical protein LH478_06405 [Chitinophagaceae bacterium]|nr:hypothetical protein [Chitinophagaceae bacterium]